MWYALIFGGILLMLYCYRVSKSSRRPRGVTKALASQTITILMASGVVAVVCAMVNLAAGGTASRKSDRHAAELAYSKALGNVLTRETLAKSERARGILFVAPKPDSPQAEAYLNAVVDGVRESAKELPVVEVYLEIARVDTKKEQTVYDEECLLEARRTVSITELETATRKNPDNNVLICISNLPGDYAGSGFAARVRNGDLAIGFVLTDVFTLGDEIANRQISACALPQRAMAYPATAVPESAIEAFNERYHLLTEGNVQRFALHNRRMMHIQRID